MLRPKFVAAGLSAVLVIAGLTACGGEQSTADACKIVESTVASSESELTSASAGIAQGKYSTLTEAIGSLTSTLSEAEGKVTNKEVKDAVGAYRTDLESFAGLFEGVKDGDLTALASKSGEVQTLSTKLTESSKAVMNICGVS